jgi:Enoyl-(Acyl carrier protein) reductase
MAITRKANPVSAIDVSGRFQPLATIWKMLVLGAFNPAASEFCLHRGFGEGYAAQHQTAGIQMSLEEMNCRMRRSGLSRTLAGELSPQGVRVVCLRSHRIGDTLPMDPEFPKMERESFRELLEGLTLLKRLPTLAEVADTAAFLASDRAGAITGTVANLTCGSSVD